MFYTSTFFLSMMKKWNNYAGNDLCMFFIMIPKLTVEVIL
jgi:hypothetical protein